MAPEIFNNEKYTQKADVYSFGIGKSIVLTIQYESSRRKPIPHSIIIIIIIVLNIIVLWELVTRKAPFETLQSWNIPVMVVKGERPEIPKSCPKEFAHLIKS